MGSFRKAGLLLLGAALAGLAWFYLVEAAIEFGQLAMDGSSKAWGVVLIPAVGAVICFVLVLVLLTRVLRVLGIVREYKPNRTVGGRRRSR